MVEEKGYRQTVAALALLSAALLAYPAVRMFWNFEIDINEGWNAYHQVLAMAGRSLYVHDSPLYFNNYPPLSFYLVGALGQLVGDPVLAGRALSVAATLAIAWACAAVVRASGAGRADATLAGVTAVALLASFATDYLGMNDPQLLGQAFVMAGLAAYLGGPATAARAVVVAVLFSLGLLIKHNMLAVPLVVTVDLLWRGPNRARAGYLGTGLGLAMLAAGALALLVGKTFFEQLLASRTWSVERSFLLTTETVMKLQAPLAIAGLALLVGRHLRPAGLVLAWLAVGLGLGIFFGGGAGTDVNVFFDVFLAVAVGAGLAAHRLGERSRLAYGKAGFALLVNAGVLLYAPLCLGRFGVDVAGEMDGRETLFRADTEYLRGIPGVALCQSHLLCFRAGRPPFYDSFGTNQAIIAGRLPPDALIGRLRRHEIAVVQISDSPAHSPDDPPGVQTMPNRFPHFADEVFAVLAQEYVVDRVGISGRFYRPKGTP